MNPAHISTPLKQGSNEPLRVLVERLEERVFLSITSDPIRINAGGGAYTDSHGHHWAADEYYVGGSTTNTPYPVANTTDAPLYYSRRWGNFAYKIPIRPGAYVVNLYESESRVTVSGHRLFNVTANGSPVFSNVDIYAEAGLHTAIIKSFTVSETNGMIDLRFTRLRDVSTVSGIEILPQESLFSWSAPVGLSATIAPSRVLLEWTADSFTPNSLFWIERKGPADADFSFIAERKGKNVFEDRNVKVAGKYTYHLYRVATDGLSNPASVTVQVGG